MTAYITMIRHGETDWNANKRIQGQTDVELNDRGYEQAQKITDTASQHRFSAIYSSDLSRAYATAQALAVKLGLEVVATPQLRERHLGIFQGWSGDEVQSRWPGEYARYRQRDTEQNLDNGESLRQLQRRVINVFQELIARHNGEHIALITHAGVIDIVYRHPLCRPLHTARNFEIRNASVHRLACDMETWRLLDDSVCPTYGSVFAVE